MEISKYWFDGVYEFNDETLGSLANKINRFYNLTLIFEDMIYFVINHLQEPFEWMIIYLLF